MKRLEVLQIPRQRHDAQAGKDELDPVTAFLEDFEPGRGQLTLVCWGRSWTHFWGAMGNGATLREFLTSASSGHSSRPEETAHQGLVPGRRQITSQGNTSFLVRNQA